MGLLPKAVQADGTTLISIRITCGSWDSVRRPVVTTLGIDPLHFTYVPSISLWFPHLLKI